MSVSLRACLLPSILLAGLACRPTQGTDAAALGYGSPDAPATTRYDRAPIEHPAPSPWTPPSRGAASAEPPAQATVVRYAPEILAICQHVEGLAGDDERFDLGRCQTQTRTARIMRDEGRWRGLADCINGAQSYDEARDCADEHPTVLEIHEKYARESRVCLHLFGLSAVAEIGPDPALTAEEIAQFQPLLDECVDSLVEEERPGRSPEEYGAMLACIEAAETTDAAEACE